MSTLSPSFYLFIYLFLVLLGIQRASFYPCMIFVFFNDISFGLSILAFYFLSSQLNQYWKQVFLSFGLWSVEWEWLSESVWVYCLDFWIELYEIARDAYVSIILVKNVKSQTTTTKKCRFFYHVHNLIILFKLITKAWVDEVSVSLKCRSHQYKYPSMIETI